MAQTWRRFRSWLDNFFDTGPQGGLAAGGRNRPEGTDDTPEDADPAVGTATSGPEAARDLVLDFFDSLSKEVESELLYEADIPEGEERESELVDRFKPDPYARRLVEFLQSNKLFDLVVHDGSFSAVAMVLLFPRQETRERLSWGLRRKLFAALMLSMSEESKVPIAELATRYFERIHHTGLDLPGATTDELIDGLRDALHELEVDATAAQRNGGITPQLTEAETERFLTHLFARLRLRKRKQVAEALRPSAAVASFFSMFAMLFLFIATLSAQGPLRTFFVEITPEATEAVAGLVPDFLLLIFGVGSAITAHRLGAHWRGRSLRSFLRSAEGAGVINSSAIEKHLREQFDLEWRP